MSTWRRVAIGAAFLLSPGCQGTGSGPTAADIAAMQAFTHAAIADKATPTPSPTPLPSPSAFPVAPYFHPPAWLQGDWVYDEGPDDLGKDRFLEERVSSENIETLTTIDKYGFALAVSPITFDVSVALKSDGSKLVSVNEVSSTNSYSVVATEGGGSSTTTFFHTLEASGSMIFTVKTQDNTTGIGKLAGGAEMTRVQ